MQLYNDDEAIGWPATLHLQEFIYVRCESYRILVKQKVKRRKNQQQQQQQPTLASKDAQCKANTVKLHPVFLFNYILRAIEIP